MSSVLTTKSVRKIIHVDMDAFYASVEMKDNPALRGKPVVVGGSPQSRSVVSAASYEARKFGVHSAMACSRAQRLCPNAIFVPPRFSRYKEISSRIHEVFRSYATEIEPVSLDEAWLDVTTNLIGCPSATIVAKKIKADIKETIGLTCSAGVSFNKFLSKVASDEDKPDGLFVITPENATEFLWNISVKKIPGVGRVTQARLRTLGIEKGYQLKAKSESYLMEHFGKFGEYLYHIIRGRDDRPVRSHRERKSVGAENTFSEDLDYGQQLFSELDSLLTELNRRYDKLEKTARTISLKVKFADFHQITRSVTRQDIPVDQEFIRSAMAEKLNNVCNIEFKHRKIRLLGVALSGFEEKVTENGQDNIQLNLFDFLASAESL